MEVRLQSQQGTKVNGLDPVLAEIQQRLEGHPKEWLKALAQNPGNLANLEQEIHRAFAQMADRVVAGLLAQATADAAFAEVAKKSSSHRSAAEDAWWRAAAATCTFAGWVADLCNDAVLRPSAANGAWAWQGRFGVVSRVGGTGHSRRQKPGLGA